MNRDDIIRWAREADLCPWVVKVPEAEAQKLERFAALVAAAEAAKWVKGEKISIPTMAMEQEFSNYHRLGYKAGVAAKQKENERLKRENAILRQELKFAIVDDIMNMNDVTEEEADSQAEQQITWLVAHNEGAE